ncbi:hypothetical protein NKR23_g5267 [Pleurostoma richardsiae]|uniref:Uncharacterized protein n=1 Tax=Pleurostoma richardsiae TaxID=41990 RepID=A0AA38VU24_9PEZI|nr:hypothetical protein NKR23_g5267 [Pleurostoma richardsiae]
MKTLQPTDFPVAEDLPLRPTKTLFIGTSGSTFSLTTGIRDVTAVVPAKDTELTDAALEEVRSKAASQPALMTLARAAWYSFKMEARTGDAASGGVLGSLSTSLLSMGCWTLSFPADSPHSSHEIEMRPVGIGRRAHVFVQESVPYFWDVEEGAEAGGSGRCVCRLFKVITAGEDGQKKRREIARFVARRSRDREGVLLLDGDAADEVVVGLTCVALLNRLDSF